jgi:DNA-binding response OmpR family regulator
MQGAIQVLRDHVPALADREIGAGNALRRVATAIARTAKEFDLQEIESLALALQDAETHDQISSRVQALISSLENLAGAGEPNRRRILIIEDDPGTVTLLEAWLEGPQRELVSAGTAAEARGILRSRSFDLVILDVVLPDADGRDLLMEIRGDRASKGISVVVCSGLPAERAKTECLALGADHYLQKPVEPESVRAVVARQLGETANREREVVGQERGGAAEMGEVAGLAREVPPRTRKILLVEDDRVTASLIQHRLKKEGYEVVHCADGIDGFETLKAETELDLAILDVKVPGMDGFELLQRFGELPHGRRIPVIMLTSMGQEADIVRGLELGAKDYVLKPFSPVELMARVRRALGT